MAGLSSDSPATRVLMKLLRTVLYWDEGRLETVVEDNEGHRRMVHSKCLSKDRRFLIPKKWAEGVKGEIEFQQSLRLRSPSSQ